MGLELGTPNKIDDSGQEFWLSPFLIGLILVKAANLSLSMEAVS